MWPLHLLHWTYVIKLDGNLKCHKNYILKDSGLCLCNIVRQWYLCELISKLFIQLNSILTNDVEEEELICRLTVILV